MYRYINIQTCWGASLNMLFLLCLFQNQKRRVMVPVCLPQHTATHCNTLQHTAIQKTCYGACVFTVYLLATEANGPDRSWHRNTPQHTATHCNTLPYTAVSGPDHSRRCNTLKNTLQYIAPPCNKLLQQDPIIYSDLWGNAHVLQYTAAHCNTLQRTVAHQDTTVRMLAKNRKMERHCNTLQHTIQYAETQYCTYTCSSIITTHCNTLLHAHRQQFYILQHNATQCNTLQHTTERIPTATRPEYSWCSLKNLISSARASSISCAYAYINKYMRWDICMYVQTQRYKYICIYICTIV